MVACTDVLFAQLGPKTVARQGWPIWASATVIWIHLFLDWAWYVVIGLSFYSLLVTSWLKQFLSGTLNLVYVTSCIKTRFDVSSKLSFVIIHTTLLFYASLAATNLPHVIDTETSANVDISFHFIVHTWIEYKSHWISSAMVIGQYNLDCGHQYNYSIQVMLRLGVSCLVLMSVSTRFNSWDNDSCFNHSCVTASFVMW